MTRSIRAGLAAAVLAVSMACSNSATSPSELNSASGSRATLSVGVRPSPITAARCNSQCLDQSGAATSFTFSADMTIDVQDSASVGATVNSITLTGTADGRTFAPVVLSSDDIKQSARTNRVDGQATLSVPLSLMYSTPSGNPNLDISISVQATDDRSSQVTATGQVSVR